jgi:hypothetical protein
MHYNYEVQGIFGLLIVIAIIVFFICITIAPLIIWRNGNRTNRLLSLIALNVGVSPDQIRIAFYKGGGDLPRTIYDLEQIKKSEGEYQKQK